MGLEELRNKLKAKLAERSGVLKDMEELVSTVEARGADADFSAEEATKLRELRTHAEALSSDLKTIEERIADIESVEQLRKDTDARTARANGANPGNAPAANVNEPDIYRDGGEHSFFADMRSMHTNPAAAERLSRHQTYELDRRRKTGQELRATNDTGDLASLVPPYYLTEAFAPVLRNGRPTANIASTRFGLPPYGNTFTIPRGQTGTIVTSQTAENTELSSRTFTADDLTGPVVTLGAFNDLSFQSSDRARPGFGADRLIFEDIARAWAEETNRQVINGTGSNGEHWGILATTGISSVTVTDTGAITQWRQLTTALTTYLTNRKSPAEVVVMNPRRWGYFLQATDTAGRPLITPTANGPFNTMGRVTPDQELDGTIAGYIQSVPIILDPAIPTTLSYDTTQSNTTDPIIVTRGSDLYMMEESRVPNRMEIMPAGKNLTRTLLAWGYQGFTAGRYPEATLVLVGSGLTTPPEVG